MSNPSHTSPKRRRHILLPALLIGLGAVVAFMPASSCSTDKGSTDSLSADSLTADSIVQHTFRIAVLPLAECDPLAAALQHGLLDSTDMEVRLDTFLSAMDADTAFMNGWVQMMVTDTFRMAYLNTIIKGTTIKSVITDTLHLSMLTTKSSRIKSTQSLKDKIVAVTRNSAIDRFADRTMERAHLKPEELNRPQINNIVLRASMLNLSQYDGAILPEPFATQCEEQGARRIAVMQEPQMRVVVKSDVQRQHKDDIAKIVDAYWQERNKQLHHSKP